MDIKDLPSDTLHVVYQHLESKITELKKEITHRTGSEEESQIMDEVDKLTKFNKILFKLYENRFENETEFENELPKFKEGDIVKYSYSKYKVVKIHKDAKNLIYKYDIEIVNKKSSNWRCPPFMPRCSENELKQYE